MPHPLHVQGAGVTTVFSDIVQVAAGVATVSLYFGKTIPAAMAVPAVPATETTPALPALPAVPVSTKLDSHQVITRAGALLLMNNLATALGYTVTPTATAATNASVQSAAHSPTVPNSTTAVPVPKTLMHAETIAAPIKAAAPLVHAAAPPSAPSLVTTAPPAPAPETIQQLMVSPTNEPSEPPVPHPTTLQPVATPPGTWSKNHQTLAENAHAVGTTK